MGARTRTLDMPGVKGGTCVRTDTKTNTTETYQSYEPYGLTSVMHDNDTGWHKENDMDSTTTSISGGYINGPYDEPGRYDHYYNDYGTSACHAIPIPAPYGYDGGVIKPWLQQVADSHPGEPPVSIPNFLFELKDLPGMLKHAGNKAKALEKAAKGKDVKEHLYSKRAAAEDWLNYNFGWKPFINDLSNLQKMSKWANKRLSYLNNKSYVRTYGECGSSTGRSQKLGSIQAGRISINTTVNCRKTRREWWVAHWLINTVQLSAIQNNRSVQLFHELNLGSPIDVIYNAVPWSWLVDWCIDLGSLIKTYSNKFGVSLKAVNHMTQTEEEIITTVRKAPKDFPWMSDAVATTILKDRWSGLPSIFDAPRSVNCLGASQLATLSALMVTKVR